MFVLVARVVTFTVVSLFETELVEVATSVENVEDDLAVVADDESVILFVEITVTVP